MWHYVDIHDQLICLTSSLYPQMEALLEPFSNQPPAPAKLLVFYHFKCFIFGKQIAELDWNQSTNGDLLADKPQLLLIQPITRNPQNSFFWDSLCLCDIQHRNPRVVRGVSGVQTHPNCMLTTPDEQRRKMLHVTSINAAFSFPSIRQRCNTFPCT